MRVLVIVDTYVPARISGALQMRDLAREMLVQGLSPTVVVAAPGLEVPWLIERIDEVEVLRIRTLQTKDVGLVRRALAECLLPFSMLRGLRNSPLRAVRWDGLVWYSPTIFFGPMVRALKRRHGCRAYLILRDLFPDWAVDAGIMRKGLAYRFFKAVERYQYASADVIGVQTPANVPLVQADCRAGGGRIEVLNNWLSEPARAPAATAPFPAQLAGKTVFVYTGNMGAAQGMDCLIELALHFKTRSDVGFLFVGRGSEVSRLRQAAAAARLDQVVFMDEVDVVEIPALLDHCHIGLIALDPRHTTHNIPGKFLTYLHAGLPVLARINPGNDLQAMIDSEAVGRACSGDAQAELAVLAEELLAHPELRARMGHNARMLIDKAFLTSSIVAQVAKGLGLRGTAGEPLSDSP